MRALAVPCKRDSGAKQMTATKAARTPGPWAVHPVYDLDQANIHNVALGDTLSEIEGAYQFFTDDGRGNGLPIVGSAADAEFIVTACNAYDADQQRIAELTEALNKVIEMSVWDNGEDCAGIARAALAGRKNA